MLEPSSPSPAADSVLGTARAALCHLHFPGERLPFATQVPQPETCPALGALELEEPCPGGASRDPPASRNSPHTLLEPASCPGAAPSQCSPWQHLLVSDVWLVM